MKINNILNKCLLMTTFVLSSTFLVSMQGPRPNRSVDYKEASVLLITSWNNGPKYALLGRESCGKSRGQWDNFGGGKDHADNNNFLTTAVRELQEESVYTLGSTSMVRAKVKKSRVIINKKLKTVTYVTYFNHNILENVSHNFYKALAKTNKRSCKEKNALAWVKYKDLKKAINNAPKDRHGKLITPITINGKMVNPNNTSFRAQQPITLELRPFFVNKLQGLI